MEYMIKKLDNELKYVRNAPWVKMDQLPRFNDIDEIVREEDEQWNSGKAERDRRWKERNPAGRGELR